MCAIIEFDSNGNEIKRESILRRIFGCRHKRTSWMRKSEIKKLMTDEELAYVRCLDCGRAIEVDADTLVRTGRILNT